MSRALVWLRGDLRLRDHLALQLAQRRGEVPIFVMRVASFACRNALDPLASGRR